MDGREGGAIWLYRRLISSPVWSLPDAQFKAWMGLLLSANWHDSTVIIQGQPKVIRRGQVLLAQRKMADLCRVSRGALERALAALTRLDMVEMEAAYPGRKASHNPTIVTIRNYDKYQDAAAEHQAENRAEDEPKTGPKTGPIQEGKKGRREEEKPCAAPLALLPVGTKKNGVTNGAAKPKALPDPLRRVLSDALVAAYLGERGTGYGFDAAKDGQGLSRLLGWSRDIDEHVRRWRLALREPAGDYSFRAETIASFATGRIWNHWASSAPSRALTEPSRPELT